MFARCSWSDSGSGFRSGDELVLVVNLLSPCSFVFEALGPERVEGLEDIVEQFRR